MNGTYRVSEINLKTSKLIRSVLAEAETVHEGAEAASKILKKIASIHLSLYLLSMGISIVDVEMSKESYVAWAAQFWAASTGRNGLPLGTV